MKTRNVIIIIVLLIGALGFQSVRFNNIKSDYYYAIQNNKAYESQLVELNNEKKVFLFTIDQLLYTNDKTIHELDSVRKELNIKDSKIKQMGKIKEYIYVTDSVVTHDTIFVDPDFSMDTCIGDDWYLNCIHMEYPNMISSSIDVNTEQSVFLHITRETVNPPRRTWLGRLFLKKHNVYNITVIEHNPHMGIRENKFIIIK